MATTESCKACRATLGSLVKRHTADRCPLIAGSYCGLCASYGHSPYNCPDTTSRAYREPHYIEQLVPASVLEELNIRTMTLIPGCPVSKLPEEERVWEVLETDEGLRAALTNLGVKPMRCQEKGKKEAKEIQENKRRLQGIADATGFKVVYIRMGGDAGAAGAAEPVEVEQPARPKKKGSK